MPTLRQLLISRLTRFYPLYSGSGRFANNKLIRKITGDSKELVWTRVPGGMVRAPLNDYIGRTVFYIGDLDPKITWICSQLVKEGDTVIDIGAHIGIVTLWLSALVGKSGKVLSFEPNPELIELLKETIDYNLISNVTIHPVALGAIRSSLELRVPKFYTGAASLIRNRELIDCDVFNVPVHTLSEIVTNENIKSIRLIKIDVEGYEADVLHGGRDVLENIKPEVIIFEANDVYTGLVRDVPIFKLLSEFGYGFFSIPKCIFRMSLKRMDIRSEKKLSGHDFLAVLKGECYEKVAGLIQAPI